MEILTKCACGLDVHQATVVACLLTLRDHGKVEKQMRSLGTKTRELVELRQWLEAEGCTHVAMESTGVYWKPVYAILEEGPFELTVANAQHIKHVPGRKTDVKDAEWIADLQLHSLLKPSFVPPKLIRQLRDLTRYRRKLVESRSAERNRLLKVLETANIKLSSVASDVFGVSGMLMLGKLAEGKATPAGMAQLAKGRLREKIAELEPALEGRMEEHHRYLLQLQLRRLRDLDQDLKELDARIQAKLQPYQQEMDLLMGIPGVDWGGAAVIMAELGPDLKAFPSASQVSCWAGLAPGNHQSAGKRRNARVTKGNVHLKTALVEAAHAAARQGDLSAGQILSRQRPARRQASGGHGRSQNSGGGLPYAFQKGPLQGSGRCVSGYAQQAPTHAKLDPALRTPRLLRHRTITSCLIRRCNRQERHFHSRDTEVTEKRRR
ncbi:MAG: IS110 family transposase [Terriglobia bacterium]|jgi:transposase